MGDFTTEVFHFLLSNITSVKRQKPKRRFEMENTKLRTQAEVNEFAGTSIKGDLTIEGSDISDLSPLSALTFVGGDLVIWHNSALTNLEGLRNITSVGGELWIEGNPSLTNLDGLSNLTSVGENLVIRHNPALVNLDGLSNITSVSGYLCIDRNPSPTNFNGLCKITGNKIKNFREKLLNIKDIFRIF